MTSIQRAHKKYRETHREEIRRKFREAYWADPAKYRENHRRWYRKNLEHARSRKRVAARKRRLKVMGAWKELLAWKILK